jgi:hypothetical protein
MRKHIFLLIFSLFYGLMCFSAQVKTGYWKGIPGQEFRKEGNIHQYRINLLEWGELIVTRIPVKLGMKSLTITSLLFWAGRIQNSPLSTV